jgi:hypothetical protein
VLLPPRSISRGDGLWFSSSGSVKNSSNFSSSYEVFFLKKSWKRMIKMKSQ